MTHARLMAVRLKTKFQIQVHYLTNKILTAGYPCHIALIEKVSLSHTFTTGPFMNKLPIGADPEH